MSYFVLIFAAEKIFTIRCLFGKYFCALTSSRRSRRNQLPHFRLNTVKNIKAWLSLRSYLRKSGPFHSIEFIVSSVVYMGGFFISYVCIKYLYDLNFKKAEHRFIDEYLNWEVFSFSILLSFFIFRFVSYSKQLTSKYNNNSELLTEQLNLYLQLDVNPQKKHHYSIANNVLKLASKLIKELEPTYKMPLLVMNPLLGNFLRFVLLSLVSGVLSELFGISFKFWKLKG
ncbi:putative homeodomain transcription factor 2 [Thelohanellus kitauei]|uniref:Putative homeodomain transcription factor 2 n=1 Tax=Thelohanellus kitauei TaxID=669202 RepID=A0A0C2MDN7_THEKT|nr:putative homeodomain transcription factor 2 [Thelohanellus kitauei]